MASSSYLSALCILLFLAAATNIAFANSSYGNGSNYGYGRAPKSNLKKHLPTKGLIPASIIAVQGMIYCKSGSKLIPLKGAVARITCLGVEKNYGYETAPFSFSSYQSDSKGYYYAVFSLKEHKGYEYCKITQCKAFLESSSLEECDTPTDENKGKTGALLTSYRFLSGKNTLLYSVAPFVYTSDDYKSNYQGEGY